MHAFILCIVFAQDPQEDLKKLQEQMKQMQAEFDAKLKTMQRQIDKLKLQIPEEPDVAPAPQTPPPGPNVFNPTVSVVSNFLWRFDDKHVFVDDDPTADRVDNTVNLREVEVDFRAAIDPFADGVAILSFGADVPGEYSIDAEEVYAVIKRLPVGFMDPLPLKMKIKVGRFRPALGNINILHRHDLPQSDRPLVVQEFLGPEGFNANGLSFNMFLPWFEDDATLELTTEVLQGGHMRAADGTRDLAYVGNLRYFTQLDDENSLQASAIVHYGTTDDSSNFPSTTLSFDALYKWKSGEWSSFILGGQAFYGDREAAGGVHTTPFGAYAFAQYQLDRPWFVGVRADYTETIGDDTKERRSISPFITWYPDEFLRFRLSYEHQWSDLAYEDDLDTMFFEVNWIFGAHPPEPFWVNR